MRSQGVRRGKARVLRAITAGCAASWSAVATAQPAPYPAQAPYPSQPMPPAPPLVAAAPATAPSTSRSPGEMSFLYLVGAGYGVGSGVWIDALGKVTDPGLALLAPLGLGAGVPLGFYLWDRVEPLERGLPASIGTGMLLGGVEGLAIDGLQWQATGNGGPNTWSFAGQTTAVFLGATAGGIAGYAFGEWAQPDPRSLALIGSGAGWGAIAGTLIGAGAVDGDWKDGASVWGFAGYNVGIVATGALSMAYVPSWQTIKYMWLGDLVGTLVTMPVYIFYVGDSENMHHGLIANAAGGLAGLALAAALTGGMSDPPGAASWTPPFQLAVGPAGRGGAQLTAYGSF